MIHPVPGSAAELERFAELQRRLNRQFKDLFPNPRLPRTVVVVPSLTLDPEELSKIMGVHHYEERMLFMLMLLRMPKTRLVYVTSQPVSEQIIDYYLQLLPGVPGGNARRRLTMLACYDANPAKSLTRKVLERPRLMERIREVVGDPDWAHLATFNTTADERTLAVRLGIPIYANDPALNDLGSKSGCREIFREAGVDLPAGRERLRDLEDVVRALADLKRERPDMRRAVVKLNEGFSGEGNAIVRLDDAPADASDLELGAWIGSVLPRRLAFEAETETYERFGEKFAKMGGVVEEFIETIDEKRSPSAQCLIDPLGRTVAVSTHDQVLGGPSGQVYLGCTFPASEEYRLEIQDSSMKISQALAARGAMGRLGVDYVSVREGDRWRSYAIEVNLRKGGTTHPFLLLKFLTDGRYDPATGLFYSPTGQAKYYYASDNLVKNPGYQGLTPEDLVDIVVYRGLHFHTVSQQGVVFHMIGTLSQFGKLGTLSIGNTPEAAMDFHRKLESNLDAEAARYESDQFRPKTVMLQQLDPRTFTDQ